MSMNGIVSVDMVAAKIGDVSIVVVVDAGAAVPEGNGDVVSGDAIDGGVLTRVSNDGGTVVYLSGGRDKVIGVW